MGEPPRWVVVSRRDQALVARVVRRPLRLVRLLDDNRHPRPGLIFHTDRGIEYAAYAFRARFAGLGFVQSMNRPREVTDNAHMESFFHSMKPDVVHGVSVASPDELSRLLCRYIPYYNRVRLHSALGYRSPVDYEARRA